MSIGSRIKEFRTKRGLTQSQMAEKLQMTEANFSSYERDKSVPPSNRLDQISKILNVSSDYLLGRSDDPNPEINRTDQVDEETYMIARKLQKLTPQNRLLLNDLIKSMEKHGDNALEDEDD